VSDVVIRQASLDDVPELAELRRSFTSEDPPTGKPRADFDDAFRAVVGEGLRVGSWVVWVAESEGEIVAHAFVAVVPKVPRPVETPRRIGYLTNVYTHPDHRGHGLGEMLLAATTDWARQQGIELLIVWPSERSISLYRRHGFVSSGEPLVWTNPDAE
jgi:GNAT superfamily N-acetyltransferase